MMCLSNFRLGYIQISFASLTLQLLLLLQICTIVDGSRQGKNKVNSKVHNLILKHTHIPERFFSITKDDNHHIRI